ncbi:prevent-host-death protein [bacterium]|nr:prevent-host-death protein [bacterium]NBS52508.1 prevent-host-death protein [Spartobacteria bacterium]
MEMLQLPVVDFKSRFSEALEIVARGGTVCVTYKRRRKPVAVLSPPPHKDVKQKLGMLAGKVHFQISSDWEISDQELLES